MQVSSVGTQATQYASPLSSLALDDSSDSDSSSSFANVLTDAIKSADATDAADKQGTAALLSGDVNNLSDVVVESQKADISLRLTVQIRNRVIDAYNEVMRMQV
jgi:flagellar hook-basal body complex protein FliE